MTNAIITAENLGKRYKLRHEAQVPYQTLREALTAKARRVFSAGRPDAHLATHEDFWALRDINFEIHRGDVVGIIGRNGAGKSTLLKILSRITEPTTGRIRLRGRVASLLEVGTGFHPELTGRENIFLNGSILGMSKGEIRRNFDEIVSFAEVEKFLDTPVKHYSSGMYVRLAFAVAAHLESDVLIVDEVLAVGDAAFQRKCLGKMKGVASAGKTILFVSHNTQAIHALCSRGIVMDRGRLVLSECVDDCLRFYAASYGKLNAFWSRHGHALTKPLAVETVHAELSGSQPELELDVTVTLRSQAEHRPAMLAIEIGGANGAILMQSLPRLEAFIHHENKEHCARITVKLPPLIPGEYTVSVWAGSHFTETLDEVRDAQVFEVASSPTIGRTFPHHFSHGQIVPVSEIADYHTGDRGDA